METTVLVTRLTITVVSSISTIIISFSPCSIKSKRDVLFRHLKLRLKWGMECLDSRFPLYPAVRQKRVKLNRLTHSKHLNKIKRVNTYYLKKKVVIVTRSTSRPSQFFVLDTSF